jgi:hypothetical protein
MTTNTFEQATEFLNFSGFNKIAGDEIFATFKNDKGEVAFVFMNGINQSDGFTVEIN